MIAVIDYGMGNLRSVQKAFEKVGAHCTITDRPENIRKAEKVVLPGVGAMKPAMSRLQGLNLTEPIQESIEAGKPFLGICLGFQLLFDSSDEGGAVSGLKIEQGTVRRFGEGQKIPHMGWNSIRIRQTDCPLFANIPEESYFYFCHSYFVSPQDTTSTATETQYGITFTSSIRRKNVFGVQFHPEKSQDLGLQILKNFTELSL